MPRGDAHALVFECKTHADVALTAAHYSELRLCLRCVRDFAERLRALDDELAVRLD